MRLRSSLAALVALVLVVVVAPEATGKGGTVITSCGQTVTTSAVLGQDLFCNGDGIVVGAGKITINLNGHTLFGDGDINDVGVHVGNGCCDNVTVENGVIRDFGDGVYSLLNERVVVRDVAVSGNTATGIFLDGPSDSVVSSTAFGNNEGIAVYGQNSAMTSSSASGNNVGLIFGGLDGKARSVIASGNRSEGIVVDSLGEGASVTSSTANGNGSIGIRVFADSVTLNRNTADGNGFDNAAGTDHDHFDFQGLGITVIGLNPSGKNTAQGNDNEAECDPSYLC